MKLALVIPWFGLDIAGGAERLCRELAHNLNKRGLPVEILTTCAREFQSDWNVDHYQEGCYQEGGLLVRRFKVRPGNRRLFDHINYKLLRGWKVSYQEEQVFMREMINSQGLYRYIREHQDDYLFFFIPYLFGTSYWGSQICPQHSFLIPCLHDEAYAYMRVMREMFEGVRGILFNSQPEYELAHRLYNLERVRTMVLGVGMELEVSADPDRFRTKYQIEEPFILYVGRKDRTKGTQQLIDYFSHYLAQPRNRRDLRLVLLGKGEIEIPRPLRGQILDLGFVPQQDKYDAYAAALCLCQPSVNESFSYVLMESWLCHTPVLVNHRCAVTRQHCLVSQGGLYYQNYFEFEECLNCLLADPRLREALAQKGREYVRTNHNWDTIISRFRREVLDWLGVSP